MMQAQRRVAHRFWALALLLATSFAAARPIRIEFDNFLVDNDSDGFIDGNADWSNYAAVDVTGGGVATGNTGFGLHVGSEANSVYCANEDGVIWFTTVPGACGSSPVGPIFSVLGADWATDPTAQAPAPGAFSVSVGRVDREATVDGDGNLIWDPLEAVTTLRFLWNHVLLEGGDGFTEYSFEALFYDVGGGDFDVEFLYGDSGDSPYTFGDQFIANAGVTLFQGAAPYSDTPNFLFHFIDGVFSRDGGEPPPPPPTSVPEPASGWLMLAGLGLIGLARRLRAPAHVI
jgi:PEP-CTERM motif